MIVFSLLVCLAGDPLAEGRSHLNHGRYEEAIEAFSSIGGGDPVAAALGVSRAMIETGRYDEAAKALDDALAASPNDPGLLARRGELKLQKGQFTEAMADAETALKAATEHPAAHRVKAEALTEAGRIAEAVEEYRWFVRFYNRRQPKDPDTLVYVAKGSVRYARWKRVSSIFNFVVNELCPDLAKADPEDWRADAISGELLLEKYNEAQGHPDLVKALAKNPRAAEVHAVLAAAAVEDHDFGKAVGHIDAALETNPACLRALNSKADIAIAEGNFGAAREAVAAALAVNPHDQESLARKVALTVLTGEADRKVVITAIAAIESSGPGGAENGSDLDGLVANLLQRNPKPGAFLGRLGETLEGRRLYAEAERAYEASIKVMPEASEPQVSLALLTMRAGDLKRAKPILDAAFKADPFHVRVNNMRKVIGLLESYEAVETPHFVIRFDPSKDRVLAELAAEYLESVYPELTGEFGFEPPRKTVVELFQTGKGQSGHQWFSARMVGLPWVQTVGASTGLMVALTSPTAGRGYNWARVLRHEFTHVVTLQQTEFRIPHWYTEALAVRSEGYPRPDEWDDLLRERVTKGELRTFDELNSAFVRPKTPDDWQFAYCQSLLYAQHIDDRFGPETHRKLLDGYARGRTTEQAIAESTGLSAVEFEKGYREHLADLVKDLGLASHDDKPTPEVRETLKEALAALRAKNFDRAISTLTESLDREQPQPHVLELLGRAKLMAGDAGAAADLFALGRKTFPRDRRWLKLRAAAMLKAGDSPDVKPLLEELSVTDADDAVAAKKLAELALGAGDAAAAKQWAMRALFAEPNDATTHLRLAEACEALGENERAATARRHAELLKTKDTAGIDGGAE